MRNHQLSQAACAIAQAAAVVGEWWTLLIVRDIAGGIHRFDELQAELAISRKVLSERLAALVAEGVLDRRRYQERPRRYEYHLTPAGEALIPVLIALQDWGSRYVLGDGTVSATADPRSREALRVAALAGARMPKLALASSDGHPRDPVADADSTVLFCYPGAYAVSSAYPEGWGEIQGAVGCTLEAATFGDRFSEFASLGAKVAGVSTQRPDDQRAFAEKARLPYPLLSDQELRLAAALRLPTFRAGGRDHLKRLTLIVSGEREIRHVIYPIADPAASVDRALALLAQSGRPRASAAEST